MTDTDVRRELASGGERFVSEATGFDAGALFQGPDEVRGYFVTTVLRDIFGECPWTQGQLDLMADAVIEQRWHLAAAAGER